ncbi:RNA polymerase II subunit A C-terminal domain phosphatase [Fukomys damarensis]|uniref:protein-serine/threonine phosphatase n=1 Tax=Fukomys damarensis TaxID=885580 RepID=A0A091CRF1_FUKDA|nr:RNA polymerase II subunit A C-terminal domain phosphatase [Fukomys damarensis]
MGKVKRRGREKAPATQDGARILQQGGTSDMNRGKLSGAGPLGESETGVPAHDKGPDLDVQEEGESLDQSEEEEEEDTDDDDHLIHLEILVHVHTDYYTKYDRYLNRELKEAPETWKIVPELKSKVLVDVTVISSGLQPTNFPAEKTQEHYLGPARGAKVLTQLGLSPDALTGPPM